MSNRGVKVILYMEYGHYCWLCGEKFDSKHLTLHHIIPKVFQGETIVENGMILCQHCHFDKVNAIEYGTEDYWLLMNKAMNFATQLKVVRA